MPIGAIIPAIVKGATALGGAVGTKGAVALGASALGGALSGREGARTSTVTPTIAPGFENLADLLTSRAESRIRQGGLPEGFEERGIRNINETFRGVEQSLQNRLAGRGLLGSGIESTALTNLELGRGGEIARFQGEIPIIERQLQDTDFQNALRLLAFGQGQTGVGPGSAAGGGATDAASMLGFLLATGALGGPQSEAQRAAKILGTSDLSKVRTGAFL